MWYSFLQVVIILSLVQLQKCENNETFCVKFDDPTAFMPMPKLSNKNTEYYHDVKTYQFPIIDQLIKRVKIPFPLSNSIEVPLGPIFDFRFYNLTYTLSMKVEALNNISPQSEFYFSIRAANLDNLTNFKTDFKWHQIKYTRNGSNDIVSEDLNLNTSYHTFGDDLVFSNNYFFHNYSFAYFVNPISVRKPLYKSSQSEFCIHFFLKMCNECTLTVYNSTYEQLYTTRNKSAWNFEHFCVHNIHMNDTIEIQTNFPGKNSFWAFGDELYILPDRHLRQYLHLPPIDDDGYVNNFERYCQDVKNANVTITNDWKLYFKQLTEKVDRKPVAAELSNYLLYTLAITVTVLFLLILMAGAYFYKNQKSFINDDEEIEMLLKTTFLHKQDDLDMDKWNKEELKWREQFNEINKISVSQVPQHKKNNDLHTSDICARIHGNHNDYFIIQSKDDEMFETTVLCIIHEAIKYVIYVTAHNENYNNWAWRHNKNDKFQITIIEQTFYNYYVKKNIEIKSENNILNIDLYHFFSWPEPHKQFFSWTLLPLLEIMHDFSQINNKIMLHSFNPEVNLGLIALSDVAQKSDSPTFRNLFETTKNLKESSPYCPTLVKTYEDYRMAYILIFNRKLNVVSSIPYDSQFKIALDNYTRKKSELKAWQFATVRFNTLKQLYNYKTYEDDDIKEKNRYQDRTIYEHSRVLINSNRYINATFVNGYAFYQQYITTQVPLVNTRLDFWTMVIENKFKNIINLNELEQEDWYFPSNCNAIMNISPNIKIECVSQCKNINKYFSICTVEISNGNIVNEINLVNVKKWFKYSKVPDASNNGEEIIELIAFIQERFYEEKAVICCYDGITACGLFLLCMHFITEIQQVGNFDPVGCMEAIRISHDEFICQEQFQFCYKVAKCFFSRNPC